MNTIGSIHLSTRFTSLRRYVTEYPGKQLFHFCMLSYLAVTCVAARLQAVTALELC